LEVKPGTPRPRIEGLSDLIFGLALSIGAIQLLGSNPSGINEVTRALTAFAFSFLILIVVWNRYTTFTSAVQVETNALIRLNILLMFLVAVEPYLFNILQASWGDLSRDVSVYYALDIGGMNLVLAYFAEILTRKEKGLLPASTIHRFKLHRNALLAVGSIFLVSALPIFWDIPIVISMDVTLRLREVLWAISIPVTNAVKNVREVRARSHGAASSKS